MSNVDNSGGGAHESVGPDGIGAKIPGEGCPDREEYCCDREKPDARDSAAEGRSLHRGRDDAEIVFGLEGDRHGATLRYKAKLCNTK